MALVRCKNKQCGHLIAYVNGTPPNVTCDKCGRVRRLYYEKPTPAIRLTIKVNNSAA